MFVLVYSITDRSSFEEVQQIQKFVAMAKEGAIFVLVANKVCNVKAEFTRAIFSLELFATIFFVLGIVATNSEE